MKLNWKYFVMEPRSKTKGDPLAAAARGAMSKYADLIQDTDSEFAEEIRAWVCREVAEEENFPDE